jgi:cytochrome d ubiquinol oxidase subunit II
LDGVSSSGTGCACADYFKNLSQARKDGGAFVTTGLAIVFTIASYFFALFPNVMISSIDANFNLTIANASSSPYTLKVMSIVALIFVPVVLTYQIWSYIVFRKRVKADPKTLIY